MNTFKRGDSVLLIDDDDHTYSNCIGTFLGLESGYDNMCLVTFKGPRCRGIDWIAPYDELVGYNPDTGTLVTTPSFKHKDLLAGFNKILEEHIRGQDTAAPVDQDGDDGFAQPTAFVSTVWRGDMQPVSDTRGSDTEVPLSSGPMPDTRDSRYTVHHRCVWTTAQQPTYVVFERLAGGEDIMHTWTEGQIRDAVNIDRMHRDQGADTRRSSGTPRSRHNRTYTGRST